MLSPLLPTGVYNMFDWLRNVVRCVESTFVVLVRNLKFLSVPFIQCSILCFIDYLEIFGRLDLDPP